MKLLTKPRNLAQKGDNLRGLCSALRLFLLNALRSALMRCAGSVPLHADLRRAFLGAPGEGLPGARTVNPFVFHFAVAKRNPDKACTVSPIMDLQIHHPRVIGYLVCVAENRCDVSLIHSVINRVKIHLCDPAPWHETPRADNDRQEQCGDEPDCPAAGKSHAQIVPLNRA
jgi:hypothetical protein